METVTIKRTQKGVWMKRFDDYEKSFTRISKEEAIEDIMRARKKGVMFCDDDINSMCPLFGYYN